MLHYRWRTHGVPFVKKNGSWEIDIYVGDSFLSLAPTKRARNPVLTANDVRDVRAYFVADPFMLRDGDGWYMFFEVLNRASQRGEIAYATSRDALRWRYQRVVLAEPFHLSFPHVFRWRDEYYMVPESFEAQSVRLYRAVTFPETWRHEQDLLVGYEYIDPTVFMWNARWWMYTANRDNDTLRLFFADELTGPWREHPRSPVVRKDSSMARPGGPVLVLGDRVIRYAQDCGPAYGARVRAFEVTQLTTTAYEERLLSDAPVSRPGQDAAKRAHHIDPHRFGASDWIACGDSFREGIVFGLRY